MKKTIEFTRLELHSLYEAIGLELAHLLYQKSTNISHVMVISLLLKMQSKVGQKILLHNSPKDIKYSFNILELQALKQLMGSLIDMIDRWENDSLQTAVGKLDRLLVSM